MNKKLLLILFLAVLVRLVFFLQIKDHFLFKEPILDAKYYHEWAQEISKGDWLSLKRGVFMMSPGYSYFLAIIYKTSGVNVSAVAGLQFIMGLLSGILIYFIGKKTFSKNAGLIAAVFFLFYSLELFYESALLKSVLINFLNLLAVYLVMSEIRGRYIVAGMLLGFSIHLRPNIIALIPFFLIWIFNNEDIHYRSVMTFILGLTLMVAPVVARNYMVSGELVLSTAHGGMNFFTGNSKYCLGPYTPMPFARTDPEVEQKDFLREAQKRSQRALTAKESSQFWYKESFDYIKNNTKKWAKLMLRKALIFTNSYEPAINLDYYFFKEQYKSVLSLPFFGFGLILPLAFMGYIYCNKNQLINSFIGVYFLLNVVFFVVSEYRFPVVPFLCLYAGAFVEYIYKLYSNKEVKKIIKPAVLAVLLVFAVNYDIYSNVFGYKMYKTANLCNSYFGLGCTYESKGRVNDAIETYKQAISIMPQTGPMINLANIYETKGDLDSALELYEQAIKYNPRSSEAYNNLGSVLFKKGNLPGALKAFESALKINPDFVQAQNNYNITANAVRNGKK